MVLNHLDYNFWTLVATPSKNKNLFPNLVFWETKYFKGFCEPTKSSWLLYLCLIPCHRFNFFPPTSICQEWATLLLKRHSKSTMFFFFFPEKAHPEWMIHTETQPLVFLLLSMQNLNGAPSHVRTCLPSKIFYKSPLFFHLWSLGG